MEYQDYYKTLGVPRSASAAEIKKAFRKLAREHHPDRNPGDKGAEKRFKDVNEAHAVLSDADKRKQYDALGADWARYAGATNGGADPFGPGGPFAGFGGGTSTGRGQRGNVRYEFRTSGGGEGFSDFFRTFFAGEEAGRSAAQQRARAGASAGESFDDILEQLRRETGGSTTGRTQGRTASRPPATEIEAPTELTLEEAFSGTTRIVDVEGKRYEVIIPQGVDTGSRVKLSGKGPDGRDIVVLIRVRPHRTFTRRAADLERELPVTLGEALLGAKVPVATLKGRVLLTIPPATQNGQTFRLSGQGMPRIKRDGSGDLYVKVRVVLPTNLSEAAATSARGFIELADQPDPRAPSD
jgi:curved DNA-binding protein